MYNIAIIGAGSIAGFQVQAFRSAGFEVVAAASSKDSKTIKQFCNKHNIAEAFLDPRVLVFSEIWDAIYISVPTKEALTYIDMLANCKKPILVEKPVSLCSSDLLKKINLSNIRVAYNRRFYDGVKYIKNYLIENSENVLVKVCIPESSFRKNLNVQPSLPPLTYENSVHMFDLINFLCGEVTWKYKEIIHDKTGDNIKFIVGNGTSANSYKIMLDVYYDATANFSMEFLTKNDQLILRPLEIMTHFRGFEVKEPTQEVPLRVYSLKKYHSIIEINSEGLKPGLLRQAKAFYNFCKGDLNTDLATLENAANALRSVENLL